MSAELGFGLMRLPLKDHHDEGSIDIEKTKELVDIYMKSGFNYFDTAWMYCDYKSESAIKEALTSRYPRESFRLATKLHVNYVNSPLDCDKIFNRQLEKTGVDFFDVYLIHALNAVRYDLCKKYKCIEWLMEKQQQGLVKKIGFSFHGNPDVLEQILTEYPAIQYVQLQLNYMDWDSESVQAKKCCEIVSRHNKSIIVMEPVKGGLLVDIPPYIKARFKELHPDWSPASWAVRFAASQKNVEIVLSGMSTTEQMLDNIHTLSDPFVFGDAENKLVSNAAKELYEDKEIQCTSCSYCTSKCPQGIPIPKYFALHNGYVLDQRYDALGSQFAYYLDMSKTYPKASTCIECGQCEDICPQNLPIRDYLKLVVKDFE